MSSSDKTLPFLIDYLPEEHRKVAQIELNENFERLSFYIEDLKRMAKEDKVLKDIELHPDFLHQFIRVSKFKTHVAFKRLQKYINLRKKMGGFFMGFQNKISTKPRYSWGFPLPWRSPDGCAMIVLKFGMWDSVITWEEIHQMLHMLFNQSLRNPLTQIQGFKLILDCKDTSLRDLRHLTPSGMYQVCQMYLECVPGRFKSFHCVNCSATLRIAWSLVKPFLSEKLRSRVLFHKDLKELLDYFPRHTLSVEFGGDIEDYYMYTWMKEASDQMGLSTFSGQENTFVE